MASILKVDTIQDQSGNNIINENADTITIGASGDTITVPTGASLTVPNGGLTGQNYPAFSALGNGEQSLSDATETLVEFPNKQFDTDNCFDNTAGNYKFTPNVAGKYCLYFTLDPYSTTDDKLLKAAGYLYKNGTRINSNFYNFNQSGSSGITAHNVPITQSFIVEANGSSDYFQVKVYVDVSSGTPAIFGNTTTSQNLNFAGYRIGA